MKRTLLSIAATVAWLTALGCGSDGEVGTSTRFDGTWHGETSQGRAVDLVIHDGRIAIFEIGYRVAGGGGCSRGDDVTLVPDPAQNRVRDGRFSFESEVADLTDFDGTVLDLEGDFADDGHVNGKLTIARPSPCSTESYLWSAAR